MGIKEDIKAFIIRSGFTMTQVVDELNKRNGTDYSLANFSKKINNETIRYNEVLEIADICGYNIEWIEKSTK